MLANISYKLGNEVWPVYEQVCVAACDCGQIKLAEDCLHALKHQFPSSTRISWLHGLIAEAANDYDGALQIYDSLLKKDETNSLVWKRKIAIHRSRGNTVDAIKELSRYLQQHMSDMEAWLELCDLHLQEQDYARAAFCLEELLLANPYNHMIHQKYAEIKYTQGGTENMEIAKKYFGQAIKLNRNNNRALFGYFLSANNLAQSAKTSSGKAADKKRNEELASTTWKQLADRYQKNSTIRLQTTGDKGGDLKVLFDALQITSLASPSASS
jgi:tetratricopeptide (TPR) repeat protein